jgi:hypothetical protein
MLRYIITIIIQTEFSSFQGKSVEEGIETPIWLIELPHVVKPEYQGQFFYDGAVGVIWKPKSYQILNQYTEHTAQLLYELTLTSRT